MIQMGGAGRRLIPTVKTAAARSGGISQLHRGQ